MSIHNHITNGDISALNAEMANGISVETRDEEGRTLLMVAAASPKAGTELLQVLLDHGADVNALSLPEDDSHAKSVLSYAAKMSSHCEIILLIEAGANVSYVDPKGYSILLNAMHRMCENSAEEEKAIIDTLVDAGAPLDAESSYGESALSVASHRGNFMLVSFLLEQGANSDPLVWSPLFHEVASGNLEAVTKLVDDGAALDQQDRWGRTPFLLSVFAGNREVAKFLLEYGSDLSAKGRSGCTALMYAIKRDDVAMLNWLVSLGCDIEETDEYSDFPLRLAAEESAVECVQALIDAEVDVTRRNEFGSGAIGSAASPEIVNLLVAAGADLGEIGTSMRRQLVGTRLENELEVSEQKYHQNRHRIFGKRHPERMNNLFWDSMVRTRVSAYTGAERYDDNNFDRDPVWCFYRYGQSITRLPDGRYVEIAGEHEDSYDPDFCIYNDVIVHQGNGKFDIYGYPEDDFPPTDFHTATLVWPYIYIIGNLGYQDKRMSGKTPVFRLCCETWCIEPIECKDDPPGWIHEHKANLVGDQKIVISGGKIKDGSTENLVENAKEYVLDLQTFTWRKTAKD